MADIFISYRHREASHVAGRVQDRLKHDFGDDAVFVDTDIRPAENFVQRINDEIERCKVLLVFVGSTWLEILAERQGVTDDFVRLEIETALRLGKPITPLMVDGVTMPSTRELPSELSEFAKCHAIPIRAGNDFNTDYGRLVNHLEGLGLHSRLSEGLDPVVQARLEQIAGLLASVLEVDAIKSPRNYSAPLRALLADEVRNTTGITAKLDDVVIIEKIGWQLIMFELQAAFEDAFDVELQFSLDSSAESVYADIFSGD